MNNVEIENLTPEYLARCVLRYEYMKKASNKCNRAKRERDPEAAREREREYMRRTGKALEYYHANKERILAQKREAYRLKKQKQKEEEEETSKIPIL